MTSTFYTKDQWNKLGNSLIYFSERDPYLSKTKALKLLYLLEETSLQKFGIPFLGLRFDVWKLGPVVRDVFVDLSNDQPSLLSTYIKTETDIENNKVIRPVKEFNDDEFSDNDIAILDLVLSTFKDKSAKELVLLTHRKHSPWYLTAQKNNLLEYFDEGLINSTDVEIDFTTLFSEDLSKLEIYRDYKEFLEQKKHLKH